MSDNQEAIIEAIERASKETARRGDWIQTYTGKQFYILDPRPEDFCIEDVAHALANQCRYNGHTDRFYSVAEHSVILCSYVLFERITENKTKAEIRREACLMLMHDGSEAYLSDVPKPVKNSIPGFGKAEDHVEEVYAQAFNVPPKLPSELKELDKRIVVDEKRALMIQNVDQQWSEYDWMEPLGVTIVGYEPKVAEQMFLDLYWALTT